MYKYDTHVHTDETSRCGKVKARDVVRLYKEAGYNGVVITDHYFSGFFDNSPGITWEDKIDDYLKGYRIALDEGNKLGLTVMFGIEIKFDCEPNDYLVYGMDEEFLKENKELYKLDLAKFVELKKLKDFLIYQAHPFRKSMLRAEPNLLDGIEVYNGNPRHESNNDIAYRHALSNGLKMISGSDFHQVVDLARGGIITNKKINTINDLFITLKKDEIAELIKT
ncbi:MAG TPA: transposase [Clostridiaceae bacterium]|jgi:predicted metal-dependent phosphoesterase TrpH|nr:transposase [Clostridiaceae bacterium]